FMLLVLPPPRSTLFPYTTLFRSDPAWALVGGGPAVGLLDPIARHRRLTDDMNRRTGGEEQGVGTGHFDVGRPGRHSESDRAGPAETQPGQLQCRQVAFDRPPQRQ